jgi:predicted secreted Zn-dependent protease
MIASSSVPSPPPTIPDITTEHTTEQVPTPIVRVSYNYYPIRGVTAMELRTEMMRYGPYSDLDERKYDGYTHWHVRWSYDYAMMNEGCAITGIESSVDVTFTMPWWNVPAEASGSVVAAWNQYLGALQLHENGHMAHGVAAATEITRTLNQFPAYFSCTELREAVSLVTRQIVQHYNQKDIDYDASTQHGLTQGAMFPPHQPSASQETTPSY